MSLRRTLLLPTLALMVIVVGGTVLLSRVLVARAVERRVKDEMTDLARFISRAEGFPLNARSLSYIARAYNVQAVIARDGAVYRDLRTLSEAEAAAVLSGSGTYPLVVITPVEVDGATLQFYVVVPERVIEREKEAVMGPLLLVGIPAIALAALLAVLLALVISRPIESLAASMAAHPTDALPVPERAPREVRDLAAAFNRLLAAVRRAEQLSTVGRVAAMMAHEMRNPLSSMKLNMQLLESRGDAAAREHARRLLGEIDRLEASLNVLLDAARPVPLIKEPTVLADLVADVVQLMKPRLDHWKVGVHVEAADIPPVMIDPSRFRSVVTNLLLNAAQAMPDGGTIRVTLGNGGGAGGLRMTVEDNGRGVDEELRDRLFEPFTTTREDGMGLGLAVARRVVEEHGGRVGYEPASPGSRFWVEIPRCS